MKNILMPVSVAKKKEPRQEYDPNRHIRIGIHHLQSLETIECLTPVEKVYCLNMDILERDLYPVAPVKTG